MSNRKLVMHTESSSEYRHASASEAANLARLSALLHLFQESKIDVGKFFTGR